jgi:hypothetical protein
MANKGRPKYYKSEAQISAVFDAYKADLLKQSDEWQKVQYVGKEGMRVTDGYKVPMTLEGFFIFARKNFGCLRDYFRDYYNEYTDFAEICSNIREEIRANQIIGGMIGIFNPSITQRLNSIKEQVETTVSADSAISIKIIT